LSLYQISALLQYILFVVLLRNLQNQTLFPWRYLKLNEFDNFELSQLIQVLLLLTRLIGILKICLYNSESL